LPRLTGRDITHGHIQGLEAGVANDKKRDRRKLFAQIIARAWAEPAFKARLLSHPAEVLAEYGVSVPPGCDVVVHEDTPSVRHHILPLPPRGLTPEQLGDPSNVDPETCFCEYDREDRH
jgi:hypothetical protein